MTHGLTADHELLLDGTAGVDLPGTCRPMADGASDPTWHFGPDRVVRAMSTPDGPVTGELTLTGEGVRARTWGPGSRWLSDRVHLMVGPEVPADFAAFLQPLVLGIEWVM